MFETPFLLAFFFAFVSTILLCFLVLLILIIKKSLLAVVFIYPLENTQLTSVILCFQWLFLVLKVDHKSQLLGAKKANFCRAEHQIAHDSPLSKNGEL